MPERIEVENKVDADEVSGNMDLKKDRIVLTMKWGTVFTAEHVNILYRAVSDHLTGPFRFVCLTNEPEGFDQGIEHFPLPDLEIPTAKYYDGAWPKLAVYAQDLAGLSGRCLFIDLDSVIVSPLDAFFDCPGRYLGLDGSDNWQRHPVESVPSLNTTTFAFDIGDQTQILDRFMSDKQAAFDQFTNDQTYAEAYAEGLEYWPEGWIVSFKRHLCHSIGPDLLSRPLDPDGNVKIIAFHGSPRPSELVGKQGRWLGNFPHTIRCPVGWLDAYWAKYGG